MRTLSKHSFSLTLFISTLFVLAILPTGGCQNEIRLRVLGEDSSNLRAMESLKKEYEETEHIKIDFRPNTFADAYKKANQDFANETGLYDVILQVNFSLSSFVRHQYVYNVDSLIKKYRLNQDSLSFAFEDNLFPNAWKEVGYYYRNPFDVKDTTIQKIGYPFATNTMLLVYNKEMFDNEEQKKCYKQKYGEELCVPRTWEQYRKVAAFFTNKAKKTYGVCMQGKADGWLYYEYCDFLYGMGGKIFEKQYGWQGDETTPIKINSSEAAKATEFYISMKPYNKGNYTSVGATEQIALMKEGNIAMAIIWSDYLYSFVYDEYGKRDFGFAPIPGEKSPLAGGCFYVNKQTEHPKESMKYILSLMQPKAQVALANKGLCSPLKTTYEDEGVKRIPYSKALKESLERGTYMFEAGPESDAIMNIVTNYIQQVWNEEITVEKALDKMKSDIYKVRNNVYKRIKKAD